MSTGPTNIQGRVTGIAIDPTNNQNVYATGVGGIWRSTNGGRVWQRVSDGILVTVTSAVGVNPGNPAEVLAGLGEPDYFSGANNGLEVSTSHADPGSFTAATGPIASAVVKKIIYSPKGTNDVYLATSGGVFLGSHSGATLTFNLLGGMTASTSDIAVDFSVTPPLVYAGVEFSNGTFTNGIWKYNGTTWSERDSGIDTTKSRRIALGLAASSLNTLYARVENGTDGTLLGIFKTTTAGEVPDAGGAAWVVDSAANAAALNDSNYIWWGNVLAVDPTDPNVVFSGGISLWKRSASGWANASKGPDPTYPLQIHGDQHAIVFDPSNPKIVWAGDDGGIFRSTDMSAATWHWTSQAHGMVMTEFYRTATEQVAASIVGGGSQDNGTEITFGNHTWFNPAGGDGYDVAIDALNSSTLYGTASGRGNVPNASLFELANPVSYTPGGGSKIPLTLPSNVTVLSPVEADPTTPEIALATGQLPTPAGGAAPGMLVIKTTDGVNFTTLPLNTPNGTVINSIAISRTKNGASKKGYYVGANAGGAPTVYSSQDEGATWNTTATGLPANLSANAIAVDPTNALRAIVGFGGAAGGGIAITGDGGSTWTQLPSSGATALPAAAITGIVIDANNTNTVYMATQIGVYKGTITTSPAGSSWIPFDQGLPDGVDANRIQLNVASNVLTLATMGHGAFQRDVTPGATCPGTVLVVRDTVFDRGSTPSASGVPDPEHPIADTTRPGFYKPDDTQGGSLYWWDSTDIRIDVPSADATANAIAQADNYEFESCPVEIASCPPGTMVDRSPERGVAANAYVQVNNRGLTPATNVRVLTMFADATTHVPDLPASFWTTTFAPGSSTCGALDTSTGWNLVGCQVIPVVNPELPGVAQVNWNVPATAADHSCMMTVIDSTEDPIGGTTRATFTSSTLPQSDRHIAQRNLHVIDAPAAPGGGGGGAGVPGGGGTPYFGLTSVNVPNRASSTGVDIVLSRSGMGGGRLEFLLPTGTAGGVTGLPATCGAPPSAGSVVGVSVPKGVSTDEVVLGASQLVSLGLKDVVSGAGGPDFITNTGSLSFSIPSTTQVDSIASIGSITVLGGATVNGSATSAGAVNALPGSRVLGTVTPNASLTPFEAVTWALPSASTSKGSVDVKRNQLVTITPGMFDTITVEPGGTLILHAGTYVVGTLRGESSGKVVLSGQVSAYVNSLDLDVPLTDSSGNPTNGLIVYVGAGVVNLPGGLHATVLAPNAIVNLLDPKGYVGSFFGSQVVVGAGVSVVHEAGSAFLNLDACAPLTSSEQSSATSLGLDATKLYGVSGLEVVQHLPIPAGQTWKIGLRYEVAAGAPNTAARFRILEKELGVIVGGNTFAARH